jgi:hypothetical protein
VTAHDVPDLAYGDAPDSFDSPDGRTYSGPVTATPGRAAYEVLRAEFLRFLASQGYDDQGRFDHDEMELAFETGWQIAQAATAQPSDVAIGTWIENYPREFATWLATQRDVGGVTPEGVAAQEPHAAPECDDTGDDCPAHGEPHAAPELAAAMAETRELRTALRTLAGLWDARSDKDEETAARPNRALLVLEERATTRRGCAADIRKLAGPPS